MYSEASSFSPSSALTVWLITLGSRFSALRSRLASSESCFCSLSPRAVSLVSTLIRMEFAFSFIYPFLSMEPISAFTATSSFVPERSMSASIISPSPLSGFTSSTRSLRLTLISTPGFTSSETVAFTARSSLIPFIPSAPPISMQRHAAAAIYFSHGRLAGVFLFSTIFTSLLCSLSFSTESRISGVAFS